MTPTPIFDPGGPAPPTDRPSWSTLRQALTVVAYRPHLRASIPIALAVGTVLFAINQLDVVIGGHATAVTWVKSVVTYLVPFIVSNLGILAATRSPEAAAASGSPRRRQGRTTR